MAMLFNSLISIKYFYWTKLVLLQDQRLSKERQARACHKQRLSVSCSVSELSRPPSLHVLRGAGPLAIPATCCATGTALGLNGAVGSEGLN